jgi:hypothetical protein
MTAKRQGLWGCSDPKLIVVMITWKTIEVYTSNSELCVMWIMPITLLELEATYIDSGLQELDKLS